MAAAGGETKGISAYARRRRPMREFRPARPKSKEFLPLAFLALLGLGILPSAIAAPTIEKITGLTGLALLVAGGVWLELRGRWPGDPRLIVGPEGMTYRRGRSARSLAWSEIDAMPVDWLLRRMSFLPFEGRPIHMRPDLIAADGTAWLEVIEHYWRAPKDRSPRT